MAHDKTCASCGVQMEAGFVPTSKGGASLFQGAWHPGPPNDKTFWESISMGFSGVKVDERKLVPIYAYRCPKCELVQLYAPTASS